MQQSLRETGQKDLKTEVIALLGMQVFVTGYVRKHQIKKCAFIASWPPNFCLLLEMVLDLAAIFFFILPIKKFWEITGKTLVWNEFLFQIC